MQQRRRFEEGTSCRLDYTFLSSVSLSRSLCLARSFAPGHELRSGPSPTMMIMLSKRTVPVLYTTTTTYSSTTPLSNTVTCWCAQER